MACESVTRQILRQHLADVDSVEHGTALGILALEDILEQVVGDLRDEFDPEGEPEIERSDEGLRVPGEARLHQLAAKLGLDFGPRQEATLSGFMIERLGHLSRRVTNSNLRAHGYAQSMWTASASPA